MTRIFRKTLLALMLCLPALLQAQETAEQLLARGNTCYEQADFSAAVECYRQAAEQGNAEAQFNLAYACYNGEGTQKDYASAAMWFKRAARQGFHKAEYNLAYCYMYGRGVPTDYDKAISLLMAAATGGFQGAQVTLAECYSKGVLVAQDEAESRRWQALAEGTNPAATEPAPASEAATQPATPHKPIPMRGGRTTTDKTPPASSPSPMASQVSHAAPVIRILYPENQSTFHTRTMKVRYQLVAPGLESSTKVIAMVDGERQPQDRAVHAASTIEVDLPDHDCNIMLYAQNANGNSEPCTIRLVREEQQSQLPRLFAVAIGVGDYNDPQLPKLRFTTKDARDFSTALMGKKNLPYSEVQVKTLCNGEATPDDFFEAMQWLQQEASPTDVCVFFYAGHGFRDEKDRFYFMPYGGTTSKLYNCFSASDFMHAAEDINAKMVVFVDACYSGALMQGNRSSATQDFIRQLRTTRNGTVLYASSGADTKSKEDTSWNNGAFTKALVEAMNGQARKDNSFGLSTLQLYNYLYERVRQLTDYKQTPIFQNPNGLEHFNIFTYEP